MLRDNDIILLLGAGCSFKAGIPTSERMLIELHGRLKPDADWRQYRSLYCNLRGLILRADAKQGKFNESFNIERLVASLTEIEHRELNVLNPFIGSLHQDLTSVTGDNGAMLCDFRRSILQQLKSWVQVPHYETAEYYRGLFDFQAAYTYPLRVFTLNYDLCVEKTTPAGRTLERGFDTSTHLWDAQRFEPTDTDAPSIYYYKMHGSIDWERDSDRGNVVKEVQNTPEVPDLIFGTVNKLYPNDPYLFYAYQLRQYSLLAKCIVVIGYSFADDHINRILKQALENERTRKLLAVSPKPDEERIRMQLGGRVDHQIVTLDRTAEVYLPSLKPDTLIDEAGISLDEAADPFVDK
jgi:hypothetical protein